MKKMNYLFVVLLLSLNLPVTGQPSSNINALTEKKLTGIELNQFVQPDYASNKKALLEMKKVREMIMRSDNPVFKMKALKQVDEQMNEILFGKKTSLVNGPVKIKTKTVNGNVCKNYFHKQYSLLDQLQSQKPANNDLRRKVPAEGVMKYRLDSLIFFEKKGQEWIPKDKQEFTYNYNAMVTSNDMYLYDTTLMIWQDDEKTTISYNESGDVTLYYYQWWNKELQRWIDENIYTVEYNSNGDVLKQELYREEYDEDSLRFIKRGEFKHEYTFDTNNNEIGSVYYMWDDQKSDWILDSKHEYFFQDGYELMFAAYLWDQENQKWVGQWKFENEIVPEFDVLSSTHYNWDLLTDTWVVMHKILYEVFPGAADTTVTETHWSFDYEAEALVLDIKIVYSNLQANADDFYNSFGNIVYYNWDAQQAEWVYDSKTTNTFDSYGNITHCYDSIWVNAGGEGNEWMVKVAIEANVNVAGLISDYVVTNWSYDGTTNKIYGKIQYLNTYSEKKELIQQIKQEWDFDGQTWKNVTKEEYAYDESGNLIRQIWYDSYNPETMVWNAQYKTELGYNADGSEALRAYYVWSIALQDWRLTNKYENYYDEYGKPVLEASTQWNDNLQREIINYKNEKVYDNQRNLIVESHIYSNVVLVGSQYYLQTGGEKVENNFNSSGQLLSSIEYYYINEVFVPDEKYEYTYHSAYPTAIETEYVYTWNQSTSTWKNEGKGVLTSNFEVPRKDLIAPFQGEDDSREVKMYFSYMATELLQYSWSNITQSWMEDSKVLVYYTQSEFSSIDKVDLEPVSVYPNPVTDFLTIRLKEHSIANFRLFDLQGRKLYEAPVNNQSKIDVSGFVNGIYFYQLTKDNETISGKLLKK
ncbi:MAG: T9SS type A sorting domain-containing protein [Paludibacter sp.]|nr:T9SS type A sorting domain-containing protein [Paludibacter sp.]MDD4198344.1 T9SS type A sorting domain-containing protein [Paludibacter sp.]MDD4428085.1 T9SS type A sorting domain-containing protein [Paludibacter sp.]